MAGTIAAGALAGVASDPNIRAGALDAIDGQSVPVPGVPWLKAQIKAKDPRRSHNRPRETIFTVIRACAICRKSVAPQHL